MSSIENVNPQKLYPMVSIESIEPQILKEVIETMEIGTKVSPVKVISYEGYYLVVEGIYEMLAANILHKSEISIVNMDLSERGIWSSGKNIEEQLSSIGLRTLYDFETLGGFRYVEYPVYYKGER